MTLGIICVILGFLLAFCYNSIEDRRKNKIGFKGSYDCTGLPIIKLNQNNKQFNFIVDSGSNISHLCSSQYNNIHSKPLVDSGNVVTGIGGEVAESNICEIILQDSKNNSYKVKMTVSEHLEGVAKAIKEVTGIEVHGLLGTDFLNTYKCNIDFNDQTVSTKNGKKSNTTSRKGSKP